MLVAIGEATKLLSFLEKEDKVYEVSILLGATSETYDSEGPIRVAKTVQKVSKTEIGKALKKYFSGERLQKPPIYSAVQIGGKRAYQLARSGQSVDLKSKKVFFHDIKIMDFKWPVLKCRVHCSSGTYIRSFAHDLGVILGAGAYCQDLRRISIGRFTRSQAISIDHVPKKIIEDSVTAPEKFLKDWSRIDLQEREYRVLAHGGVILHRMHRKPVPMLALYEKQCVGILERTPDGTKLKFLKKFNTVE